MEFAKGEVSKHGPGRCNIYDNSKFIFPKYEQRLICMICFETLAKRDNYGLVEHYRTKHHPLQDV